MELLIEKTLKIFLKGEVRGAVLLFLMTFMAIVFVNSPWREEYMTLVSLPVSLQIGDLALTKPAFVWVNEFLMALFFLLVTLEIKREFLVGHFSKDMSSILLPAVAAFFGMAVPALIYILIAGPEGFSGWAIPAATDIAFSLGVVAILGSRVPYVARLFLMAVAVFDDLGAIAVIAVFYSHGINITYLIFSLILITVLFVLNRARVYSLYPHLVVGLLLWWCVLMSGFHATLSGVLVALFIPCLDEKTCIKKGIVNPTEKLEIGLTPLVTLFVLPLFALVNVYLPFDQLEGSMTDPVTLAIALGLILGKPIGIFGSTYVMVKAKLAKLPEGLDFSRLLGVSAICGIGFTMSLFIGRLAFAGGGVDPKVILGVLSGSIISALIGAVILVIAPLNDRKSGSIRKNTQ